MAGAAVPSSPEARTPPAIAEYEPTSYRFEDGFLANTLFFGWAALLHLRHRARHEGRPEINPVRWIVIGTPSSAWHMMAEVAVEADMRIFGVADEWSARVKEASHAAREMPAAAAESRGLKDLLDGFAARVGESLGTDLRMRAIDDSADSIFACLRDDLDDGASVILDITHGFRTMPVHAILALGALRWLKSVEVEDILYGGIEKKGKAAYAPAVSLVSSARLARAVPGLAQLALVDDVGHVGEFFEASDPEAAQRLRETQRYESLMQFAKAAGPRGQAIGRLRALRSGASAASEITRTVADRVAETLASLDAGSGSLGLRNRAERALERDDFMRAISLANEMLLLKAVELRGLKGDYDTLNAAARKEVIRQATLSAAPSVEGRDARGCFLTLNFLRNSVMHPDGGIAEQDAPNAIRSRTQMRALLGWSLEFYGFLA